VHDLPARGLREVTPYEDDDEREHRAHEVGDPPAPSRLDVVERPQRDDRAEDGARPVRSVDREVDPAAVLGRDHLVDRGVDRGVLAADAHARDNPRGIEEDEPVAAVRRHRGEAAADQVDAERDHEEVPPAELVGQPPEEERSDDLADQVPPGDVADRSGGHVEGVPELKVGPDVGGDGDLEAVEDPRDAERHY